MESLRLAKTSRIVKTNPNGYMKTLVMVSEPRLVFSSQSAGTWQKSESAEFWCRSGQSGRQDQAQVWSSATDSRFWAEQELTEAVSPSSLHKLATFKPNLPCNDSHPMFFQKQQRNV